MSRAVQDSHRMRLLPRNSPGFRGRSLQISSRYLQISYRYPILQIGFALSFALQRLPPLSCVVPLYKQLNRRR